MSPPTKCMETGEDNRGWRCWPAESAHLIPGMPVDLYIRTGERTLLDYLTRPLQDLFARALNEA